MPELLVSCGRRAHAGADNREDRDEHDRDPDEAPETPLDEPPPTPVQDPPGPNDGKAPYVVRANRRASNRNQRRTATVSTERRERRGFASMSPDKQREIASKGGRAAHEKGTAHEWTADEARSAGRKGGQVSRGGRGRLIVPDLPAPTPGNEGNPQ